MTSYDIGIDLGTTWTAAAVRIGGRVELARLGSRRAEIPSLVYAQADGRLLVGDVAERRGLSDAAGLAREFKRRIGDPVPIMLAGVPYAAHELTAALLRQVLDTVAGWHGGPPTTVTLTCPANWGAYRRDLLDQAVALAGAGPVRVLTEPEAAAVQHATARAIAVGETVAVYDLGGGTFDAAVLRRDSSGFVLLGEPEGVGHLGGSDFDEAVFGHVLAVLGERTGALDPTDPDAVAGMSRLRLSCVEAKEALSYDTEVLIPVALPGLHTRVRLTRSELEAMIGPSLQDTVAAMRRALSAAGVGPAGVSAILLAGGSSRIPLVESLLATEFGRPVVADAHPEHSIALGAATAGLPAAAPRVSAVPRPIVSASPEPSTPAMPPAPAAPLPSGGTTVRLSTVSMPPASTPGPAMPLPAMSPPPMPPPAMPPPLPAADLPPEPARRRTVLLMAAVLVAVLVLVGGATGVLLAGDKDPAATGTGDALPPSAAAPSEPARTGLGGPFPADPILIRVDTAGAEPPERRSNIFVFTPGSDTRRQLTTGGSDVLPKWSHDRTQIVFSRLGKVNSAYVMKADGSGVRKVVDDLIYGRVTWSMDDRRLAFVRKVDGVNQIFTVAPGSAADPVQLTRSAFEKDDPEWMPDGKHLTYWVSHNGAKKIFALNVAKPREPGRLIAGPEVGPVNDPVPSPDGKLLLFTRETGPDTSDIWVVGTDGSNPHRVIGNPQPEYNPTWSRDGRWFVFGRGALNRPTVVVARADGSGETTLTSGRAREGNPHWY